MVNTTFTVKPRQEVGKAVKKLRQARQVPAQIMGAMEKPISVVFSEAAFVKLYESVGDTGLVYVSVEGESKPHPVLIEEVQVNPLTGQVMHVLLKQVNLNEKIEAEVPVELVNGKEIPGAVVITVRDVIEVQALPADLPEKFEVDISGLTEIGQDIKFSQLNYDKSKVKLMISEEELDTPVVLLQAVKEEVEETPAEVPAEGEAAGEAAATPAAETEAKSE